MKLKLIKFLIKLCYGLEEINPIDDYYYIYLRHNSANPCRRFIQYSKTRDFIKFTKCELINIINDDKKEIYTPGVFKYFNSNYFLSIPTIHNGDRNVKNLMISNNNVDWKIIDSNLFSTEKYKFAVHGMVPSNDNKKIFIYIFL